MVSTHDPHMEDKKYTKQYWFNAKSDEELANGVFDVIKDISKRQFYRTEQNYRYYKLYTNTDYRGVTVNDYSLNSRMSMLSLNVIQSITDTVTSNIGKNKPKVTFLTDDGDYKMRKRAEKLEMFTHGQFNKSKVYKTSPLALKRACVFGSGFLKPYIQDGEIKVDNVYPEEIKIDERELDNPRSIYQVKLVSRQMMIQMFPSKEEDIRAVRQNSYSEVFKVSTSDFSIDLIPVIEAWHLPSRKGAKDGLRALVIENCVLEQNSYDKCYFPFVKMNFSDDVSGWFGIGVSQLLTGIQYEINKTLKRIQQSIHLGAVPRVFYEIGSVSSKATFNNEIGSMVPYKRTMPQIITPQTVGAEVFNHLDRLYQRAFEIIGVSQMSAGGKKMEGLDSGEAIRTFRDVETARFAVLQEAYDEMHVELAEHMIDLAKEIAEQDPKYNVLAKTSKGVVKIPWKEVNMKEDSYVLGAYPTSLLPSEPAGKLATTIEMAQAQLITPQQATQLLDFPDIKQVVNIQNAKMDDIEKTIYHMIDTGEYLPPEIYQDLQTGIEYCQAYYLMFRTQKVDQARLNLLTQWMSDANAILTPPEDEEMIEQSMLAASMPEEEQTAATAGMPDLAEVEQEVGLVPQV